MSTVAIKLDLVTGEPVFDIGLGQIEQPRTTLDEIFTYLETADKPCVVCIDEFQQIMNYEEKNIEALLRTKVQECKKTLFIFSGSRRHLSVISMDLKPLDKSVYSDFAKKLFNEYGKRIHPDLFEKAYDQYEGVTWYVQMLLNELFAIAKEGIAMNVTSSGFLKRYGLGAASSVQAAIKGLLEKDLITRTEKGYRIYDYFLAEWIRWNF